MGTSREKCHIDLVEMDRLAGLMVRAEGARGRGVKRRVSKVAGLLAAMRLPASS